jgi:hypothetical protein
VDADEHLAIGVAAYAHILRELVARADALVVPPMFPGGRILADP